MAVVSEFWDHYLENKPEDSFVNIFKLFYLTVLVLTNSNKEEQQTSLVTLTLCTTSLPPRTRI